MYITIYGSFKGDRAPNLSSILPINNLLIRTGENEHKRELQDQEPTLDLFERLRCRAVDLPFDQHVFADELAAHIFQMESSFHRCQSMSLYWRGSVAPANKLGSNEGCYMVDQRLVKGTT